MQRLVDYSSSSDSEVEDNAAYIRRKKLKLRQEGTQDSPKQEETQASPKAGANDNPTMKLLELGCSFQEVTKAISVCGESVPVEDAFDYIQAQRYNLTLEVTLEQEPEQTGQSEDEPEHVSENHTVNAAKDTGHDHKHDKFMATNAHEYEDGPGTPLQKLTRMGFTEDDVQHASEECNSVDVDDILEYLLNPNAFSESTPKNGINPHNEDKDDEDKSFIKLRRMGFSTVQINNAADKCGTRDLDHLFTFLIEDKNLNDKSGLIFKRKKKKRSTNLNSEIPRNVSCGIDDEKLTSPQKDARQQDWFESPPRKCPDFGQEMENSSTMGFSIPERFIGRPKELLSLMQGPPYFYFEKAAGPSMPEWNTIKRFFGGVEPEFTDSKYFSACSQIRGYVHNLPITERKLILPRPPMTIFAAFPYTEHFWPSWDKRAKLTCLSTRRIREKESAQAANLFERFKEIGMPVSHQQKLLEDAEIYDLVWVGPGQVASLEPHEVELVLGFDRDHTRGFPMTCRYDLLENAFQIDTVAYHLSPLKSLYPEGITVLSLFSGIGGAEVALERLGVFLKCVVVVEINKKARDVIASWWKKSGQKGRLELEFKHDVRELTYDVLTCLVCRVGIIDLVIGGSPTNTNNDSTLIAEFPRILENLRQLMKAGKTQSK